MTSEVEVRIDMWLSSQDTATIQDVATVELQSFVSSPVDSATISDVATLEFDEAIELPISVDSATIQDTPTVEVWWDHFLEIIDAATIQDSATVFIEGGGGEEPPAEISKTDRATIKDQPTAFIYDFIGNQFVSQVLTEVEAVDVGERQVTQVLSEVDSYNVGNRWVSQVLKLALEENSNCTPQFRVVWYSRPP